MIVRFSPRAARDLREISDYIRLRNPAAARRVKAEITRTLDLIAEHPRSGRRQEGGLLKHTLSRYPYYIYYEWDEVRGVVGIVTIRHTSRASFAE